MVGGLVDLNDLPYRISGCWDRGRAIEATRLRQFVNAVRNRSKLLVNSIQLGMHN